MSNVFAFAFAQGGFEAIVNLTELDEKECLAKLSDKPSDANTPSSVMHYLKLRATFNQARRYEIWTLGVEEGITEGDLWHWANTNPQDLVDKIRDRGVPFHSTYPSDNAVIK